MLLIKRGMLSVDSSAPMVAFCLNIEDLKQPVTPYRA